MSELSPSSASKPSVTFVVPCLNEAQTLSSVLGRIQDTRLSSLGDRETSIIVVDNGSEDGSDRLAEQMGAQVVRCGERGYGAALQAGITAAPGELIVFADADASYDFGESPKLVQLLDSGYDLVIGSRLRGGVKPGAMPLLHRYLGTPVLTAFINSL